MSGQRQKVGGDVTNALVYWVTMRGRGYDEGAWLHRIGVVKYNGCGYNEGAWLNIMGVVTMRGRGYDKGVWI